jgi:hippurate hydrolase
MLDYMISCRRALHQIPELERQLPETCAFVQEQLKELHCQVTTPTEGSVCAFFDEGKGDTIAFRADMDALPIEEDTGLPFASTHPGKMHACGHDGHTSMLLGLARSIEGRRGTLPHNVLLIFQPAEESLGGAKPLCESGILEKYKVQCIFGFHLWPKLEKGVVFTRPGPMMAKSSELTVRFRGKSVHVARHVEGLDCLKAVNEFSLQVEEMERACLPEKIPRLLYFGKMWAGRVRNAVAAEATLEGTLRAFTVEDFEKLRLGCEDVAKKVTEQTGCTIKIELSEGYPPVTNDGKLINRVNAALGEDAPRYLEGVTLTTEDFAWYQQYIPGVFFFLGVGDTAELHSPKFVFDESVLAKGLATYEKLLYIKL